MGWKLYEVADVLRQAIEAAEAAVDMDTGELPEDWADFVNDVQMERDAKALGVACYVRELLAEADAVDTEKKRLDARAKALENRAERMKGYLAAFVPAGEKLKNQSVSIGWRKSTSVDVCVPPETLPGEYVRTIPARVEPDKKLIGDALKEGTVIAGCTLVEKQNIQIK